jgi:hypothetical protein
MFEWFARVWCKRAHTRAMWPIHGHYICAQCLRQYPVFWEDFSPASAAGFHAVRPHRLESVVRRMPGETAVTHIVGGKRINFGGESARSRYLQPARLGTRAVDLTGMPLARALPQFRFRQKGYLNGQARFITNCDCGG